MIGVYSDITCGEACWSAKEEICKCSCSGKNHGILLKKDGSRPIRSSKIRGYMYELKRIGGYTELHRQAENLNKEAGPYRVEKYKTSVYDEVTKEVKYVDREYSHYYTYTDKGTPHTVKSATPQQIEKWIELIEYKKNHNTPYIYLLWSLVKEAENEIL